MKNEIRLIAANNTEFEIHWIGIADVDGVLRFSIAAGSDLSVIFQTFSNPANCGVLIRQNDGIEKEFSGFTVFRGLQINYNSEIIVSMSKT